MKLTLGRAHELGLCASLTASILIVLLGGEFPPWVWLAAFAPVLAMMLRRRGFTAPGSSGTLLGVAAIGAGVATLLRGGMESAVLAGGATLLGILAARTLTGRTVAHDLQAIALSLVLVLAGSVLNVGLSYFLVFVGYAISTVWALATRQLLAGATGTGVSEARARARDDVVTPLFFVGSGAVSLAVLGAAVLVFVSFPRIGFGELGFLSMKASRLPSSVGFGGDPRGLSTSTDIVARVRGVPLQRFADGLYLRGIIYDDITLDAFSQSPPDATEARVIDTRPSLPTLARGGERAGRYEVMLTPLGGDLLFVLGNVRSAQTVSGGAANPNRRLYVGGRDRHDELKATSGLASTLRYAVNGTIAAPGWVPAPVEPPMAPLAERARYLDVPPVTAKMQQALDDALGAGAAALPPEQKAARLRAWFLANFRYSLDGALVDRDRALEAFVVDVRQGHCELFAGAFALLLRMSGVPARVVGGFQGGALADDGSIVFQQRHAHAWVEWWRDDVGWIVDDATPEPSEQREELTGIAGFIDAMRRVWDDRVLDYSLADQQTAISKISRTLRGHNLGKLAKALFALVVVGGVVVFVARRVFGGGRRAQRADRLASEILAAVGRLQGAPPSTTATLREAVAGLDVAVLREAVAVYEGARFGGVVVGNDELFGLIAALRALKAKGNDDQKTP
jgi:hypothetical protein